MLVDRRKFGLGHQIAEAEPKRRRCRQAVEMSGPNAVGNAVFNAIGLREAVASIALSHPDDCGCTTCRAAAGDNAALTAIVANLMLADQSMLDG